MLYIGGANVRKYSMIGLIWSYDLKKLYGDGFDETALSAIKIL